MLQRERSRSPVARLVPLPDRTDAVGRTLSALALALLIASWATAYVGLVPPDRPTGHRVHLVEVRR